MSNQSKVRPGGVLQINAAVAKKINSPQKPVQRSPAPRLRLIIRRLPPGLTETEFWDALGSEWRTGNGKVDWHVFKEGKISKDPSKPSRPARAYLKVKEHSILEALSAKVKTTSFKDAKSTTNDPCLVGPPSLEFAPYTKTPSGRHRHDGRQGTIDQDQEFINFLQSLTEPITKPSLNGSESTQSRQDKVTITPLVQFIKEKKANKAKEKEAVAAAKGSKKNQEAKEAKVKGDARPTVVVKSSAAAPEKARVAKATQEAVKAANKSVAQIQSKMSIGKPEQKAGKESSAPAIVVAAAAAPPPPPPPPTPKPERQRGSASAASKMIARDLGLAPKEPRTPRAARNVSTAAPTATDNSPKAEGQQKVAHLTPPVASKANTTPAASVAAPAPAPAPPTGPRNNRSGQTPQAKVGQPAAQRPNKPPPQLSPGAKSAFLKHANPSQGVTEELLRTTFSTFGEVTRCEIDKKKGLGYVDFTETEALKKAMAVSPIKVGNGQVVVLENRSPYNKRQGQSSNTAAQQAGTATSTSRAPSVTSSAVMSAVTSPQPPTAVLATPQLATVAAKIAPTSTPSEDPAATEDVSSPDLRKATPTAPSAPKGARAGNAAARGVRSGAGFSPGRGSFNQTPNRARGGFRGRGSRGGKAGGSASTATGSGSSPSTPGPAGNQDSTSEAAKPAPADKA